MKILFTLLSVLLLTGPAVYAEQEEGGSPFMLGIQAANASTLDDSQLLNAKKKAGKVSKKSKKKSKKTPKED